jgi:hypothetical protein
LIVPDVNRSNDHESFASVRRLRRRHDQDGPPGVLGDVARDAPLKQLADSPHPSRPQHDQGGIDLVCNVDDALLGWKSLVSTT